MDCRWNSIQMSEQIFKHVKILFQFLANCRLQRGQKSELKLDQGSKVNFPECTFLQLFCQLSLWKRPTVDRATRFFSSLAFKENFLTGTSQSIHPFLQIRANGVLNIFVAIHLPFSTGRCDVNESCLLIREKPQSLPSLPASLLCLMVLWPYGRLSAHLKGRLGPPVSVVTFFNQRRSVGAPREWRHVF